MKVLWIAAALLLAACGFFFWRGSNKAPLLRFAEADRGLVVSTVSATGEVRPVTLVQVGSQITGRIERLYADFNDRVQAGQIVAELDTVPLAARVAQDEASLAKARANQEKVRADLDLARRELERSEKLAEEHLVPASELDSRRAACAALAAEIDVSGAQIREVQASLEMSRANLGYATIRSPIDGVVVSRSVDVGQTVAASLSAPVLFTIAQDLEKVHILAAVSESDIGRIRPGQSVRFTVDAFPDATFAGSVRQVRLAATVLQSVVTYTVVVESANPEGRLLPGMTANLRFEVAQSAPDALRVPNAALRFEPPAGWRPVKSAGTGPGEEGDGRAQRHVWILDRGAVKRVPVRIGFTDGTYTEVADGGVSPGQKVAVGVEDADGPAADMKNPFQFNRPHSGSRR